MRHPLDRHTGQLGRALRLQPGLDPKLLKHHSLRHHHHHHLHCLLASDDQPRSVKPNWQPALLLVLVLLLLLIAM